MTTLRAVQILGLSNYKLPLDTAKSAAAFFGGTNEGKPGALHLSIIREPAPESRGPVVIIPGGEFALHA